MKEYKVKLQRLTCLRCTRSWLPRSTVIKRCPFCKNPRWNIDPKDLSEGAKLTPTQKKYITRFAQLIQEGPIEDRVVLESQVNASWVKFIKDGGEEKKG